MVDVALFTVQFALQIVIPWLIVRRDLQKLPPLILSRSWNSASFWSAIVMFGVFSLPVHFIKTRRSFGGVLLGLGWMALAVTLLVAVNHGLSLALSAP